jgi:hypothetical protein
MIIMLTILCYAIAFIGYLAGRKNVFIYLLFTLCIIRSPLSITHLYVQFYTINSSSISLPYVAHSSYQNSRYYHYFRSV